MNENNNEWITYKGKKDNKHVDTTKSNSLYRYINDNYLNKKIDSDEAKYISKKKENHKKILCQNIIDDGYCKHDKECLYAHNLEEQNIDQYRKKAFDIINSHNLSNINLNDSKNKLVYKNLLILTNLCSKCIDGKCTGGYNCKYGVCKKELQICRNDLIYGNCFDIECDKMHLTYKGLQPYRKIKLNKFDKKDEIYADNLRNIEIMFKSLKNMEDTKYTYDSDEDCDVSIFD